MQINREINTDTDVWGYYTHTQLPSQSAVSSRDTHLGFYHHFLIKGTWPPWRNGFLGFQGGTGETQDEAGVSCNPGK